MSMSMMPCRTRLCSRSGLGASDPWTVDSGALEGALSCREWVADTPDGGPSHGLGPDLGPGRRPALARNGNSRF